MKKLTTFVGSAINQWLGIKFIHQVLATQILSQFSANFRQMVENGENVICIHNQEAAQLAVFGQGMSSEPLVIRPTWFKNIKRKFAKFLTKRKRRDYWRSHHWNQAPILSTCSINGFTFSQKFNRFIFWIEVLEQFSPALFARTIGKGVNFVIRELKFRGELEPAPTIMAYFSWKTS